AVFGGVWLFLIARRPRLAADASDEEIARRIRRAGAMLLLAFLLSIAGGGVLFTYGEHAPRWFDSVALVICGFWIAMLLMLLHWLKLRQLAPVPPDPDAPRCPWCEYSLKG